ncbi:hypothetical protein CHS0354_000627 [Potamilus streckersoni]|uniref:BPL/LPL catalytic domain-containing protein n=1 Tax=Potamilus streckersoni TaxID=2493646 RepID=A0AAE0W7H6_9BIVA|nr:hypothetical protein CHS0354_000627 [Potamilus streckersoni]
MDSNELADFLTTLFLPNQAPSTLHLRIRPRLYFDCVSSTNDIAKRIVSTSQHSVLIVAETQTNGRGRGGNTWFSTKGENLLFSLTLPPNIFHGGSLQPDLITLITGLAVYETLIPIFSHLPNSVRLKWPNDVLIHQKKVCGILVESLYQGNRLKSIIIGIGLNVNQQVFVTDIAERTTSLRCENGGQSLSRITILFDLLQNLFKFIDQLSHSNSNRKEILDSAINAMQILHKPVNFIWKDAHMNGKIIGISDEGKLCIQFLNGNIHILSQNEIHSVNYFL